ncbi:hypothetical protein OHS33_39605 (plasmid) [Streptomyces sp. NBC_00536]|uniref:hypothetical protein n=1 Tax=Streptomyces sp. NBC_00536 TaxID=2975769 RepID=UPI002E8218F6|nr:hypothetical protein [Streptomyces sp. NBC_00536]WUC84474.1 hypothetical protein OHS33_39605 [Streptomyces sp. NBC_00536]
MTPRLDDVLGALSLEDRLEIVRRVRTGSLTLRDGDRVKAARRLRGSYIDEELEAEGEDYRVPYDVPAGALGRLVRVRRYVTPFPYHVVFDTGEELSLGTDDVVRTDEQRSAYERELDESLWHIPESDLFRSRCSRWIDRVGRPCPQFSFHEGPCGLPPRR